MLGPLLCYKTDQQNKSSVSPNMMHDLVIRYVLVLQRAAIVYYSNASCNNDPALTVGHELTINEDEVIPRPEESRITEAERNKNISKQLEVKETSLCILQGFSQKTE